MKQNSHALQLHLTTNGRSVKGSHQGSLVGEKEIRNHVRLYSRDAFFFVESLPIQPLRRQHKHAGKEAVTRRRDTGMVTYE